MTGSPGNPARRAATAWPSSWATAVRRKTTDDDAGDRPASERRRQGLDPADLAHDGHGDDREDERPRHVDADLVPEQPGDRDAVHPAVLASGARRASCRPSSDRRRSCRARPSRRCATAATTAAMTMATTPRTSAVSSQNANGKSWTSFAVAGSKSYEPPGKKSLVEGLEEGVEGDERDQAAEHQRRDQRDRAAPDRRPVGRSTGGRPTPRRSDDHPTDRDARPSGRRTR